MNTFSKDLKDGEACEKSLIDFFITKRGCSAIKMDHDIYPFDLRVQFKNREIWDIEVKMFGRGGYKTFFAETVSKAGKISEYLEHVSQIDKVIQFNEETKVAYVFDAKMLVRYVNTRKDTAQINRKGTAYGILIQCDLKEAGFLYRISM